MNKFSVIITAGGIGMRMGANLPKQFIEVAGKPILLHTLEKLYAFDPSAEFILTLPEDWKSYWEEQLTKFNCRIEHQIVDGGAERYHSVKNALLACTGDFIAIHDGVRPFVSIETLSRCWNDVLKYKAVLPVIQVKESMRIVEGTNSNAVDRSNYRLVQTPQCFSREIILKSYEKEFHAGITDDAGLAEEAGFSIYLLDGNEENIKITTQTDLLIAETFFKI